jgi:hypothetical protein
MSTEPEVPTLAEECAAEDSRESKTLRLIGWFSAGMALAALGIYLGSELRSRYKFKRRTPYDFYAHADEQPGEYGVGI